MHVIKVETHAQRIVGNGFDCTSVKMEPRKFGIEITDDLNVSAEFLGYALKMLRLLSQLRNDVFNVGL